MNRIVNFLRLIDLHTITVMIFSCAATYLCLYFKIIIDLPTGLIGVAIIFPIVFSINAAYRRREEALKYFASFKASGAAIYYAHRDWVPQKASDQSERIKEKLEGLLVATESYLTGKAEDHSRYAGVYKKFSAISLSIEQLRDAGVTHSEISRVNQYLRYMILDFERMRNFHRYRTPIALRSYSHIFLNTFPILFAPYFAVLSTEYLYISGYFVAGFYSLVLVSLDNIQDRLEDPYDQIGKDDLRLDVAENYIQVLNAR